MTSTLTRFGRPLHFPPSLGAPGALVIPAVPLEQLERIADEVAAEGLLLFTKRLVDGARKRRFTSRWREVNVSRLQLARLCLDRALQEQLV